MNLPSPQQLRYLTALSEYGHFGRAADSCAVTQSTLSAGLIALERQLGAAILDRRFGKRPVFTPLGQELVGMARTALGALAAITEAADQAREPLTGPLRIGVIPTIGPFLLPSLMPRLREEFPRLRLFLREDTTPRLLEALEGGRLDLLLLALPCASGNAETAPLYKDELRLALPATHPLAERRSVPLNMLMAERLLLLEDGHCLRDHTLSACHLTGDRGSGFSATSLHTLVQMVAGGLGVALLPDLAVRGGVLAGTDVVIRDLESPDAYRTLGLAWRPQSPRAAEFRALARVVAKTEAEAVAA